MGLLDDAIREHLDLKRRRGADPAEVERAEREALGPVRRAPEEPDHAEPAADALPAYDHQDEPDWHEPFEEPGDEHIPTGVVAPEPIAPDFGAEPPPANRFAGDFADADSEPEHLEQDFDSPPTQPEPLALEEQPPRRRGFLGRRRQQPPVPEHDDDYLDEDDPFAEPHPETAPAPPPPSARPPAGHEAGPDQAGGETVEYEVEAAFEAERENEGEDPLEETPEFLQDTPDHDRLWFEQRPPRDFDFDG